jgi:hypothetical protein
MILDALIALVVFLALGLGIYFLKNPPRHRAE